LLRPYISKNYWIDLGINLALGKEADRIAKSRDFMFLPDYVYQIFMASGQVKEMEVVIDLSEKSKKINVFSIPLLIAIVLIFLTLLILPGTRSLTFLTYNFLIALLGVFLLILSLYSDNSAFRDNFNILWTLPALIVLITRRKIRKYVELIYLIGLIIILVFGQDLYSGFSSSFIPWISILILSYSMDLQIIRKAKVFLSNDPSFKCRNL
jgi:hypothetical protein